MDSFTALQFASLSFLSISVKNCTLPSQLVFWRSQQQCLLTFPSPEIHSNSFTSKTANWLICPAMCRHWTSSSSRHPLSSNNPLQLMLKYSPDTENVKNLQQVCCSSHTHNLLGTFAKLYLLLASEPLGLDMLRAAAGSWCPANGAQRPAGAEHWATGDEASRLIVLSYNSVVCYSLWSEWQM